MPRPNTGKDEKEGMKHLLYIRVFLIKIKPAIFGFFFFGKFIFHFLRVNTLLKKNKWIWKEPDVESTMKNDFHVQGLQWRSSAERILTFDF